MNAINKFKWVIIFSVMLNIHAALSQDKPVILYVGDPMCSWCYGFAPEISKVKAHFSKFDFKLILGGLRPGGRETMAELGDFLRHHWEQVHGRTGQPFSYEILGDSDFVYDTEPACRAVVVAKMMAPDRTLEYFKAVQTAFYAEGENTSSARLYLDIAARMGLDTQTFEELYASEEIRQKTLADFQLAGQLGVRGFPAVLLSHEGELTFVANGYTEAAALIRKIEQITQRKK